MHFSLDAHSSRNENCLELEGDDTVENFLRVYCVPSYTVCLASVSLVVAHTHHGAGVEVKEQIAGASFLPPSN